MVEAVKLSTAMKAGIVSLLVLLTASGTLIYNADKTYYCSPEDNVRECSSLTSTNITCRYFDGALIKSDICVGGTWEPISLYVNKTNVENTELADKVTVLKEFYREPVPTDGTKLNFSIIRPIIMTNAEIVKDADGVKTVQGYCRSTITG